MLSASAVSGEDYVQSCLSDCSANPLAEVQSPLVGFCAARAGGVEVDHFLVQLQRR